MSDLPAPLVPFEDFLGVFEKDDGVCGAVGRQGKGWRGPAGAEGTIEFEPTPFDHPAFIMFSSGTTGLPKCMVHGAGGAFQTVFLSFFISPLSLSPLALDSHRGRRFLYSAASQEQTLPFFSFFLIPPRAKLKKNR